MRIAVITPFFRTRSIWLEKCMASVAGQTMPCSHFLVCDGDKPKVRLAADVQVIQLPRPHADFGNTPRAMGSISAISQGYDAIAYLDSDNWYEPNHLESMWEVHRQRQAVICSSGRNLYDLDGVLLGRCPEVDGDKFVDTNCMFLTRRAFSLIAGWYLMPRSQVEIGDRVVWKALKESGLPRAHRPQATVGYRTNYIVHYEHFGKKPPPGAKRILIGPAQQANGAITHSGALPKPPEPTLQGTAAAKHAVSLCMIVKNEEKNLANCLSGAKDLFHEIVVVDTGSTDRTPIIARDFGARVIDFPWVDSFAAARNAGIDQAQGNWIFWLDADDRLDQVNRAKIQKLFNNLPEKNVAFMMTQWSVPEEPTTSALTVEHPRLFRSHPQVRWRFRIHEQILPALQELGTQVVHTDIVIRHLGYQDTSLRLRKIERNLRLLHLEHSEQPNDPFTLFNLAGSYLDKGQPEEATPYLHQCLKNALPGVSFLPKTYVLLAQSHQVMGKLEDALGFCVEGRRRFPKDVQLCFEEGLVHQALKNLDSAQRCFETVLELPHQPCYVGIDAGLKSYRAHHCLAVIYRSKKRLADAEQQWRKAVQIAPDFGPAWLGLIELLLEQQKRAEAETLIRNLQDSLPGKTIAPVLWAVFFIARKEFYRAKETMEEIIALHPNSIWLRLLFSDMLLREEKDAAAAERQLRHILKIDPHQKLARQKLEKILRSKPENGGGVA